MRKFVATLALIGGAVSFTACDSFGQAMSSHKNVLARAAGHELSVDSAVSLLAPYQQIPAKAEVVDAIGNLWIDFTLLAKAAMEDSTLNNIDLSGALTPYFNQQLVFKLRDKVITVDTMISDAQLKALFDKDQPGATVHARHVLLQLPADATPQQRDSVMTLAKSIRDQARGGADFAGLAKKYSQEPNAATSGGDLGYFPFEGPGSMVAPFAKAAFAMKPGEISDVVETTFGLHVIKVEDKKVPTFEESKVEYRQSKIASLFGDAEKSYLDKLMAEKKMEVQEGSVEVARELAKKPEQRLARRAGNRALVKYADGELTAKEYVDIMRSRQAEQRAQVESAPDDDLKEWLRMLARDEVLIERAKVAGITTNKAEEDSLKSQAHLQLLQMAKATGLNPIKIEAGQNPKQAIETAVMSYLNKVLKGEMQVVRLGAIGYALREKYEGEIFEKAVPDVVTKLEAKRPAAPSMPPGMQMPAPQQPMPPTPPATTGN
ncbi:MAG: peptidylprolyl isomerase [Longimicrobiales bacterium]